MPLNDYEIEHNQTVRTLAPECTLLLRSDGSFPLEAPCRIALFGNGARNTLRGGTGSGDVYSREITGIEQGLAEAGFTVTTKKWLDDYDALYAAAKDEWRTNLKKGKRGFAAIMSAMGSAMPEPDYDLPIDYDGYAAVYVVSRISGEGMDRTEARGDMRLSETEIRDIQALDKKFEKFLLVLNVSGVIDLSEIPDVRNILLLSQIGAQSGLVFADLLLGRSYPSGKLSTTWSALEDYCPIGEFGNQDDTRYLEGVYVGYRYFDSVGVKALFPFGFGLSYTAFDIQTTDVTADGTTVQARAHITNMGGFRGKEVVQLYVSVPSGKLDQPYQALAAFAKTPELAPGESCDVTMRFAMEDLASYDVDDQAYILEPGSYILRVGSSSVDTQAEAEVVLDRQVTVRRAKAVLGSCGFKDWAPCVPTDACEDPAPRTLRIDAEAFTTVETSPAPAGDIPTIVKQMTDEELCLVNIGNISGGFLSVVGNASNKVAGAAGDFTSAFVDRGFPLTVTADGPAGLRISREYVVDKKGVVQPIGNDKLTIIGDALPKSIVALSDRFARRPKRGETVHEQYCTMIPIATAVAQSFNVQVAEALGDIVGSEMERFGVDLWLAPALNIHRNIRCGRNFEYYSEDPLLSGKMAAAVTRGVQAHSGCGVTIKHYAANNQETNRYKNNSLVSERAMRDIYLKGFGICVREAAPKAAMTSYNLVNGVRTAEHKGLIERILRDEFGFNGVVMTDWIVHPMFKGGKYAEPQSWKIAKAGGNVVMPGSKEDYKVLVEGLKTGLVSREQLEANAAVMYRLAKELNETRDA
ncbi:Thermostable beta-glucosidase B [Slackia heliotrinireducens]|uniref:Beta-glucosidase-like glycosyl hydrolase n=1 Tax=Slackia heliotrinireducens (strain ATCC 29202 / DSM 20476 / NCTC 11029 / RHS 1) TaxID=471855 RepID=C7N7A4_SLAHD|nr:glycoside hydrolase family 3 protein [Slackia heliotrinireducens]ACV22789.1 beta-glucosidase-like glycosyl hydrolase [Slackia heliotrinireducens DSM 20476]VEH01480.1 Thermostable beta-glucosidase B [Slackia heliotrinireducens]